jgi:hypothetical protein
MRHKVTRSIMDRAASRSAGLADTANSPQRMRAAEKATFTLEYTVIRNRVHRKKYLSTTILRVFRGDY